MRVLSKYINKQVALYFSFVFITIISFIALNQFFLVFKESLNTPFLLKEILFVVSLKTLSDLSLVLVISLYIGIIITLANFDRNSESVIFSSVGIGFSKLIALASPVISIFFVLTAAVSLFLSPFLNLNVEKLRSEALNDYERIKFTEASFQYLNNKNSILFIEKIHTDHFLNEETYTNLFLYSKDKDSGKIDVILAPLGKKTILNNTYYLNLIKGKKYQFDTDFLNYQIDKFDNLSINLNTYSRRKEFFDKISFASTYELFSKNRNMNESAELFWRVIMPFSLAFLSTFALLLKNSSVRSSRGKNIFIGFCAITIYFSLILFMKSELANNVFSFYEALLISVISSFFLLILFRFLKKYYVL